MCWQTYYKATHKHLYIYNFSDIIRKMVKERGGFPLTRMKRRFISSFPLRKISLLDLHLGMAAPI